VRVCVKLAGAMQSISTPTPSCQSCPGFRIWDFGFPPAQRGTPSGHNSAQTPKSALFPENAPTGGHFSIWPPVVRSGRKCLTVALFATVGHFVIWPGVTFSRDEESTVEDAQDGRDSLPSLRFLVPLRLVLLPTPRAGDFAAWKACADRRGARRVGAGWWPGCGGRRSWLLSLLRGSAARCPWQCPIAVAMP
jgi:hypothetical protein